MNQFAQQPQPYPTAPVGFPPPYQIPYAPPYAMERHPNRKLAAKAVNRGAIVTMLQTVASFVFAFPVVFVCQLFGVNLYSDAMAYQLFNAAAVPLTTALPFVVYYLLQKRRGTAEPLRFEHVGFGMSLLLVFAGLGICLLGNYPAAGIQDFFSNFGYNPGDSASLMPDANSVSLLVVQFLSTAVLVPVMEELAFRGVLLGSLKKFGPGLSVTVSALIFALVHLDFSNVVFAFIAGLVFGALYYYTENLWLSIAIHALNNGLAVLGTSLPQVTHADSMAMEIFFAYVPVLAGLVCILVLLFLLRGKKLRFSGTGKQAAVPLSFADGVVATVSSPVFWLLVAMMLAYTTTLFF